MTDLMAALQASLLATKRVQHEEATSTGQVPFGSMPVTHDRDCDVHNGSDCSCYPQCCGNGCPECDRGRE